MKRVAKRNRSRTPHYWQTTVFFYHMTCTCVPVAKKSRGLRVVNRLPLKLPLKSCPTHLSRNEFTTRGLYTGFEGRGVVADVIKNMTKKTRKIEVGQVDGGDGLKSLSSAGALRTALRWTCQRWKGRACSCLVSRKERIRTHLRAISASAMTRWRPSSTSRSRTQRTKWASVQPRSRRPAAAFI